MKPIKINCPLCNSLITIEMEIETVTCPSCGQVFKVKIEIILEKITYEKIL